MCMTCKDKRRYFITQMKQQPSDKTLKVIQRLIIGPSVKFLPYSTEQINLLHTLRDDHLT